MVKRVLTQWQAGEIRRLRLEKNEWGDAKWTGMEIAVSLGISESTVWRVLNKQAAYAKMGKVEPGGLSMEMAAAALANAPVAGMEKEAQDSYQRLQERLTKLVPPPSPIDELSESAKARLETYK